MNEFLKNEIKITCDMLGLDTQKALSVIYLYEKICNPYTNPEISRAFENCRKQRIKKLTPAIIEDFLRDKKNREEKSPKQCIVAGCRATGTLPGYSYPKNSIVFCQNHKSESEHSINYFMNKYGGEFGCFPKL